jgi:glutamate dehydrogenase (NAD(P)+)
MRDSNLIDMVVAHISRCGRDMGLDENVLEILRSSLQELRVSLPVRMDNGKLKVFQGFRVQCNNVIGSTKGGVRFHPNQTWRGSSSGSPHDLEVCPTRLTSGGAVDGVICNPKELSKGELERLSRAHICDWIGGRSKRANFRSGG